ncbi:MAG: hypothetical protein AVDCRST_MAG38-879 [uncultured Solirubrobacteraceae bacterium]|uniref:DUF2382 domain-containing protein n=1 Tax=uncultured Solirubrobacteraceae bacterium TaxID=1162706 RepID=A0A6J4RFX8_9ACTN|nr:MAG: hypothetical protein AVDCRST_MAG38-879 [uncultured Solirubrobacteraceae bacterium]
MTSDAIGDINDAQGRDLVDSDGESLGRIREIFLDETTGRPAWAAVDAPGGGDDLVLAPLAHSTRDGEAIRVAVTRAQVESSPSTTGLTERFSPEHMDRVRAHYDARPEGLATGATGRSTGDADLDTGATGHGDLAAGAVDYGAGRETTRGGELPSAMTRSEEEFVVARERVAHERVRIVKRIVTETVTQTVEVRREELHFERVALSDAGHGTGAPESTGMTDATAHEHSAGVGIEGTPATGATSPSAGGGSGAGRSGEPGAGSFSAGGLSALRARASSLVGRAGERFGGAQGFGEAFAPETLDLTLYEEELVVSKRVVPRERVRIHREVVTEQQRISDDLRKEQIEVEHLPLETDARVEGFGAGGDVQR